MANDVDLGFIYVFAGTIKNRCLICNAHTTKFIKLLINIFCQAGSKGKTHPAQKMKYVFRSHHPEVFLRKGVLKIYSKFTGEQSWWSLISIELQSNFIEITLRYGCSPVNLLHIFRTPFPKNTSGRLLLFIKDFFRKCDKICRKLHCWCYCNYNNAFSQIFSWFL